MNRRVSMNWAPSILPRHHRRWPVRVAAVAMLSVICGVVWLLGPLVAGAQTNAAVEIHKVKGASWHAEFGQPVWILVLGTDTRSGPVENDRGRCDAIHLIGIDPRSKAGSILDFPRDSYVDVPGHGGNRINTACFFGGPDLMVTTIKQLTGIQPQYYVLTEFSHFIQIVEDLGGVDVNVPYSMHDPVGSGANFNPGVIHMGGGQALQFCRNRHSTPNGDFSRSENQGNFLIAGLTKFRNESADQSKLFDYIRAARRNTKITVPLGDLIKLGLLARQIDPANITNIGMPGSTGDVGGASVVFLHPGDIYDRVRDDAIF